MRYNNENSSLLQTGGEILQTELRKVPSQTRAMAKVEAILEAATDILEEAGEAALTTSAVAERAHVSVGTVYKYFADRESIVAAIVNTVADKAAVEFAKIVSARKHEDLGQSIRTIFEDLVRFYARRPNLYLAIRSIVTWTRARSNQLQTHDRIVEIVAGLLEHAKWPKGTGLQSDTKRVRAAELISTVVDATLHAALTQRPEWLHAVHAATNDIRTIDGETETLRSLSDFLDDFASMVVAYLVRG